MNQLARYLALALAGALALAVVGACSPTARWEYLDESAANQIQDAIEVRQDLQGRPIYVKLPADRPFYPLYYNYLKSALVARGMQVSQQQEDTLTLDYSLQVGDRPAKSSTYVVVTTTLADNNRYIVNNSEAYTVDNEDRWRYAGPGPGLGGTPRQLESRTLGVVNE